MNEDTQGQSTTNGEPEPIVQVFMEICRTLSVEGQIKIERAAGEVIAQREKSGVPS